MLSFFAGVFSFLGFLVDVVLLVVVVLVVVVFFVVVVLVLLGQRQRHKTTRAQHQVQRGRIGSF